MDIQQLRSWIFELYEPLENERQYIVYDATRGNVLIDTPAFGQRPLRLIQGTGSASLLIVTNPARAREGQRYREALGVRIAAHADDAAHISGGADIVLSDDEMVRPDVRTVRLRGKKEGATVVLLRKAGGVLVCGDLDFGSEAARDLAKLEFSAVLSAGRAPMWNAGKDNLLELQRELPRPIKQFSILVPPPWDRAYKGRLDNLMTNHDPIVPKEDTATRQAAMGPATLVVSSETRDRIERAKRPVPATTTAIGGDGAGAPVLPKTNRPRPFAEDWDAPGTESPPTTIANPAADIVPGVTRSGSAASVAGAYTPRPLG